MVVFLLLFLSFFFLSFTLFCCIFIIKNKKKYISEIWLFENISRGTSRAFLMLSSIYLWLVSITAASIYTSCGKQHLKSEQGRKEMFYLTTHSTHFIYGYMASDIWLRTILIVRKETRCRHIGYSFRLTARVLLYAPSHRQDSTYHGQSWSTGWSSMGSPHEGSIRRPIAPWANALTTELHLLQKWTKYDNNSSSSSSNNNNKTTTTTTTTTTTIIIIIIS